MNADFEELKRAVQAIAFSASPSFVAFPSAVLHVARTAACMRDPGGHCLVLGPSGTGRKTTALIASAALSLRMFQAPPPAHGVQGRGRHAAFFDAFKSALLTAGIAGEGTCMLLTDLHLADFEVMTWISAVLIGDLNLENPFSLEEWEQQMPLLKPWCEARCLSDNPEDMFHTLLEHVYENLHIVIVSDTTSPELQKALPLFPAILDHCNVDVHDEWPQDALLAVAQKVICQIDQLGRDCHQPVAEAAVAIHIAAAQFTKAPPVLHLRTLRLLTQRCQECHEKLQATKQHTLRGIEALESAEAGVADMRAELMRLAPLLAARKAAAEELQEQATKDTAAADSAFSVVAEEEALVARGAQVTTALRDEARAAVAEVCSIDFTLWAQSLNITTWYILFTDLEPQ